MVYSDYMSPEYLMQGVLSFKSDVFSFGVVFLELLSGMKSYSAFPAGKLVEHAWKMWNKGKALDLLDKSIEDEFSVDKALRCIQVGLLCVQDADDRPTMQSVLDMLEEEGITLPQPKLPGFWFDTESRLKYDYIDSTNEINITELVCR
ncbi:Cysteine-rich receptor-like protein kinase 19 [Forsythia ovata]|uniref:Cysteine-rich receptor-like protein kinase 19 n=1 Tax=Forsythia ovata TaxID=205694 RepID=A0ABD1WII1_9LAMI